MLRISYYNTILSTSKDQLVFELDDEATERVSIGSHPASHLNLTNPAIASSAAVVCKEQGRWTFVITDESTECVAGGTPLRFGQRYEIENRAKVALFPFVLTFHTVAALDTKPSDDRQRRDELVMNVLRDVHREIVPLIRFNVDTLSSEELHRAILPLEHHIIDIGRRHLVANDELEAPLAGLCLRSELLNDLFAISATDDDSWHGRDGWRRQGTAIDEREQSLDRLKDRFNKVLGLSELSSASAQVEVVDRNFWSVWDANWQRLDDVTKEYLAFRYLIKAVKDTCFGYGPLEDLIRSPDISEIMVVRRDLIFVERKGVLENSGAGWSMTV